LFNLISLKSINQTFKVFHNLWYTNSFNIQECGTSRLIGEGHESRGLCYLSNRPSMSCLASPSLKLLQGRLSHLHLSKLKRLIPELSKLLVLECESCKPGKHIRSSFSKRIETRCNSVFSITHYDISGLHKSHPLGFVILSLLLMNILVELGFT